MARPINTTAMTVYGVIDVGDCLIRRRRRLRSASSLFETDDAAMLVGARASRALPPAGRRHGAMDRVLNPVPKCHLLKARSAQLLFGCPRRC
jgi:hypothetical protein